MTICMSLTWCYPVRGGIVLACVLADLRHFGRGERGLSGWWVAPAHLGAGLRPAP